MKPSPEFQLKFLSHVQRLLDEGVFTATYKFALLHALADLAVERGAAVIDGKLMLMTRDIARRFVGLYRRQARPYPAKKETKELRQNTGKQARIVTVLKEYTSPYEGSIRRSLLRRRSVAVPESIVSEVDRTVRKMPLWKLQTLAGGERVDFLYDNLDRVGVRSITLKPGVAYCLREFYGLIIAMVRARWEQWVREKNADVLGQVTDLSEFLFGSERGDLSGFRAALLEVHGARCLYTGRTFRQEDAVVVDHFVPWSRYPVDLGHNLVLTSAQVNSSKSDHLAAEEHLERWLDTIVPGHRALSEAFEARGLSHSLSSTLSVAEWVYGQAASTGGVGWVKGSKTFAKLGDRWQGLIRDARKEIGFEADGIH